MVPKARSVSCFTTLRGCWTAKLAPTAASEFMLRTARRQLQLLLPLLLLLLLPPRVAPVTPKWPASVAKWFTSKEDRAKRAEKQQAAAVLVAKAQALAVASCQSREAAARFLGVTHTSCTLASSSLGWCAAACPSAPGREARALGLLGGGAVPRLGA